MIQLAVAITNPWSQRFRLIRSWYGRAGQHKAWEFTAYATNDIVRAELRWQIRCDHAGINLELGLLGFAVELAFCDSRHWNKIEGRWRSY
jgi:hypothetical protein